MAVTDPSSSLLDAAFDSNSIAQLVLDADGNLALANSRERAQFGIRSHELGQPFQDYHISYERTELRSRVDEARALRRTVTHDDVRWTLASGEVRYLHVELIPLLGVDNEITGVSITIADTSQARNFQIELERSRQDFDTAYEELESTVEEVETTNEELQSTNEELEAINTQVRLRKTELNDANSFLESILSSLRAGVVVIDPGFEVQAWNGRSAELWGLRADEVVGGQFLDLDIGLPVEQPKGPIQECLSAGTEASEVILPATNRVGKHIDCKVTCMPLTGNDSRIRGVIMLMEALATSG